MSSYFSSASNGQNNSPSEPTPPLQRNGDAIHGSVNHANGKTTRRRPRNRKAKSPQATDTKPLELQGHNRAPTLPNGTLLTPPDSPQEPSPQNKRESKTYFPEAVITAAEEFVDSHPHLTAQCLEKYAEHTFDTLVVAYNAAKAVTGVSLPGGPGRTANGVNLDEAAFKTAKEFLDEITNHALSRAGGGGGSSSSKKYPPKWLGHHKRNKSSQSGRKDAAKKGNGGGKDGTGKAENENPKNRWRCDKRRPTPDDPDRVCGYMNDFSATKCARCHNVRYTPEPAHEDGNGDR